MAQLKRRLALYPASRRDQRLIFDRCQLAAFAQNCSSLWMPQDQWSPVFEVFFDDRCAGLLFVEPLGCEPLLSEAI